MQILCEDRRIKRKIKKEKLHTEEKQVYPDIAPFWKVSK